MKVGLFTLEVLRRACRQLKRDGFLERYPGAFLLAMGFLSAEVIRAHAGDDEGRDATTAINFKGKLRHDAMATHPLAGQAFFISPESDGDTGLTIGRGPDCELSVPERSVSEEHCRIEVTAEGVTAIDVGSTNGTTVNLERLEPMRPKVLADEDILTLGRYSFQLLSAA
ncbi:MAG: FHA domain-containing protein, partial [Myxococcales bacterium]|nr:FHA domain-containing protein [Myxococcales bacterium]